MKSTSVRGTPMRHIGPNGQNAGTPAGFEGTVNKQYQGDQSGNRQEGISSGTPYNSKNGNPANAKRVVSQDKYGVTTDKNGDQGSHLSNGNGVLLDGVTEARDMLPTASNVEDSPVPSGSQMPAPNAAEVLANLRSGVGKQWGPSDGPGNNFQEMGGVMSRGMENISKPTEASTELLEDDYLKNLGAGGVK